jgi:beta-lactam-binding protein with PASTA domain
MRCETGAYALSGYEQQFVYTEVQHYVVPYLIGSMEAQARAQIASIYGTPIVIGSGGTVVSQAPDHMTVVLRGQTVTITMGGAINVSRSGRRRGLPPYTRGC